MISEILKSFLLIFFAEMGDKTQILAMTFATRYKMGNVLIGILLGSMLNHGLAIVFGSYMAQYIPVRSMQIVAGLAFIFFALWSLRYDDDEEDETSKQEYGPIITVALAFFIGELGDKTQLAAVTLSVDAMYPMFILIGTVSGMVVTGLLGIIVGRKIGDKVPELYVKMLSYLVFIVFGSVKLYNSVPKIYLNTVNILVFFGLLLIMSYIISRSLVKHLREGRMTLYGATSKRLYEYYNKMEEQLDIVCLGPEYCHGCSGEKCILGQTKAIVKSGLEEKDFVINDKINMDTVNKNFDREKLVETLLKTLDQLVENPENRNLKKIKYNIETILFTRSYDFENIDQYLSTIKMEQEEIYNIIVRFKNP
ncbi:MAG: TMEM165/GDT1 family protein [Firmicutes bacterium]|jgi:putative Ca2+/H+ antiporter (TMEM165/GDT1 family)|nr:TMEM165/GDT1 family protein [Bacillota bacterium]